jgi:hypothetical protein
VTEFPIPTTNSVPSGITTGPDGNLWFTEAGANQIGEVVLNAPSVSSPVPPTAFDVSALVAVRRGPAAIDPRTGLWRQRLTLHNGSGAAVEGPLFLVLDRLPRPIHLHRPAGLTEARAPLGDPFLELAVSLAPGQSVSGVLTFSNPLGRPLRYTTRVLAGAGAV